MANKVYCMFGERCKFIKFDRKEDVPDIEIVAKKVRELCEHDKYLSALIANKSVVLQMKDGNMWCDIEEVSKIRHKSVVNVVFVPEVKELVSISVSAPVENLNEDNCFVNEKENILPNDIQENQNTASQENYLEQEPTPSTSAVMKTQCILPCMKLPPLTQDLQEKMKKRTVLETQRDLIYHWGSFLWETTGGRPSKQDYQNLASIIVREYPELGSKDAGCSIVRSTLSQWIRNHRTNLKKQEKREASKRTSTGSIVKPSENAAVVVEEESQTDIDMAIKELSKRHKEGNTPHVRRLLQETFKYRRNWIENEATSISETVQQYPHLKNSDLIIFEFLKMKGTTINELSEKVNNMLQQLATFFRMNHDTEKSKVKVIMKFFEYLGKKTKITFKSLISLYEVRTETKHLKSEQGESPRCVIYSSKEDISFIYIVADYDIHVKVNGATAEKALMLLLATYYVWHVAYPKPYKNMLQYLEHEMLGNSIQKNHVLLKFIQKRDAAIKDLFNANKSLI